MVSDDLGRIKRIKKEIGIANKLLKGKSIEQFREDVGLQRAIAMTAVNIGEVTKGVSDEIKKIHSDIPWKKISGLRDIAAHKYDSLNMDALYITATRDYRNYSKSLNAVANDIKEQQKGQVSMLSSGNNTKGGQVWVSAHSRRGKPVKGHWRSKPKR